MDVRRLALTHFQAAVTILLVSTTPVRALDMEYIPPEKRQELTSEFDKAAPDPKNVLLSKKWSCEMYGVRSGLQVQRNVKLYSLSNGTDGTMKNSGAQVVSEYKLQSGKWIGRHGQFEDQLRMTSSGQLISRLSAHGSPNTAPNSVVIAYSICKSL